MGPRRQLVLEGRLLLLQLRDTKFMRRSRPPGLLLMPLRLLKLGAQLPRLTCKTLPLDLARLQR